VYRYNLGRYSIPILIRKLIITYDLKQFMLRIGLPNKLCGHDFYEVIMIILSYKVKFFENILFIFVNLQLPMILKILMLRIGLPKKNMWIILI